MKKSCLFFANDMKHKYFFCLPRFFYEVKYYDVKKGLFLAAKVHQKKANLEFSVKSQQTQAFRHHDHDKLAEKAKFRRQLLLFGRW